MRLAIIGCTGHVNYATATVGAREDLTLAALAPGCPQEDMSRLTASLKEEGKGVHLYDDWRALLDGETIDVAAVGSWMNVNADIAVECLRRGIHVYCEKPLAVSFDALARLTWAWEESGRALDGMFGLRYSPWFIALRRAVEAGEIGQVRQIHGQKSYKMGRRGPVYMKQDCYGGILPWVGIHAMDWAAQIGGSCQWIKALHSRRDNRGNGEMEVTSAALMALENGVIATVTADFLRPDGAPRHDDDRLRVTGTKGMLEAIDGRVFLENEAPRQELSLPEAPAPMADFLDSIGTPRSRELTLQALSVTRAALEARDEANEMIL